MIHLLELPIEVIDSICLYLTGKAAVNLSVSCQTLRYRAERQIWSSLSIKPTDIFPSPPQPSQYGTTRLPGRDPQSSMMLQRSIICTMIEMIQAVPWRAKMIRSLRLPVHHIVPSALTDLFRLVGPSLRSLSLVKSPGPVPYSITAQAVLLEHIFRFSPVRFDRLTRLDFGLDQKAYPVFLAILHLTPALRDVRISGESVRNGDSFESAGQCDVNIRFSEEVRRVCPDSSSITIFEEGVETIFQIREGV